MLGKKLHVKKGDTVMVMTGKDKKKNLAGETSSTAPSSQSDSGSGAKSEGSKSSTPASSEG